MKEIEQGFAIGAALVLMDAVGVIGVMLLMTLIQQ